MMINYEKIIKRIEELMKFAKEESEKEKEEWAQWYWFGIYSGCSSLHTTFLILKWLEERRRKEAERYEVTLKELNETFKGYNLTEKEMNKILRQVFMFDDDGEFESFAIVRRVVNYIEEAREKGRKEIRMDELVEEIKPIIKNLVKLTVKITANKIGKSNEKSDRKIKKSLQRKSKQRPK